MTSAGTKTAKAAAATKGKSAPAKTAAKGAAKKRSTARPRRRAATRGGTAPARKPGRHSVFVGGLVLALAAAFHVWTGVRAAELGYQRSKAIELNQRLETQREVLADRLASLLRTEHLEAESERRLGLGLPSAGQVVDLRTKQLAAASRRTVQ